MDTLYPDCETVRQRLELELDIVPPDDCSCDTSTFGDRAVTVRQAAIDGAHHADITVPSSERCCPGERGGCVLHRETSVGSACPFRAFYDEGWVPRVVRVTDEHIRVRTYLPDRESLSGLIDGLKTTTDAFQVRRLTRLTLDGDGTERDSTALDLTELTEKQQCTAIRAVEAGYYETPRETSFESLADSMGVSKSALSRRLSAVEAKLMKAAFAGMTAPSPA